MAYSQDDLDTLQRAMAKGARRLRMNGEEVEFRDLAEMERLETKIKRELGQSSGKRILYPNTATGWRP